MRERERKRTEGVEEGPVSEIFINFGRKKAAIVYHGRKKRFGWPQLDTRNVARCSLKFLAGGKRGSVSRGADVPRDATVFAVREFHLDDLAFHSTSERWYGLYGPFREQSRQQHRR